MVSYRGARRCIQFELGRTTKGAAMMDLKILSQHSLRIPEEVNNSSPFE
jgi:hypothetical protein